MQHPVALGLGLPGARGHGLTQGQAQVFRVQISDSECWERPQPFFPLQFLLGAPGIIDIRNMIIGARQPGFVWSLGEFPVPRLVTNCRELGGLKPTEISALTVSRPEV